MALSDLTDDELIDLALQESEEGEDLLDIGYYQESFYIKDGDLKIYKTHLYYHYKNWSIDPVSFGIFCDFIKLSNKAKDYFLMNSDSKLNVERIVGDYVKTERKKQKEKRSR